MNVLALIIILMIILQVQVLYIKYIIWTTWVSVGRMYSAEKLHKAILGFSPHKLLYLSNETETSKYEIMMEAICAHLGTETVYQDGIPNFRRTLWRILVRMKIRHVLNWAAFPKKSIIASILFCLPLLISAQDIHVAGFFGGASNSQEDPRAYDMGTGIIGGVTGTLTWSTTYVEASVILRESHDFNSISSFKGRGVELSVGWTTKEPPKWQLFVGPFYRTSWDTGLRMNTYGVQGQIQYGKLFAKGQLGFYDYIGYVGYAGTAAIGIRFSFRRDANSEQ